MPINKVTDKSGKPVKKDGKQKYRVRINYTDSYGNNKQIERTAYGADEAKQLERELLHSVKEETPTKKMTFGKLYEEYMAVSKTEVRESTYTGKEGKIRNHVLPYFENVRLDRLNMPTLQQWKQDINNTELNISSKRTVYKCFCAVLNYAVKMEYIAKNPLKQIGNFTDPLEGVKEMDFYTPEEFKLFITAAKSKAQTSDEMHYWCIYVFFCIAFYMGMREGEILALNWNDIRNNEISITKSYSPKSTVKITPPKNKSSIRTIQIPDPLKVVLVEHKARCETMPSFNDSYFIVGGIAPVSVASISHWGDEFARTANVKRIRIHDFRHSHASLLANSGINIQEIAKRLGHANISITLRTYAHLYPKESERALTVLNAVTID